MLGRAAFVLVCLGLSGPARAQVVVGDPLNASKTFSSYCSACHKSAAGLGRSMGSSGLNSFLKQHYTTGAQMSSVMANYLLTAKSEPPPRAQAAKQEQGPEGRRAAAPAGGETGEHQAASNRRDAPARNARTAARNAPETPAADQTPPRTGEPARSVAAVSPPAEAARPPEPERPSGDTPPVAPAAEPAKAETPTPQPDQGSFAFPSP